MFFLDVVNTVKKFYFNKKFIERYKSFMESEEYLKINEISKSQYWKYFADQVNVRIDSDSITVKGKSGFYIPKELGFSNRIYIFFKKAWHIVNCLTYCVLQRKSSTNLISYERAFNNVMNSSLHPASIGRHAINFRKIAEQDSTYTSVRNIKERFSNKYSINNQIIYSYYIYNILNAYTDLSDKKTILEIGAGNGNLLSVIHNNVPGVSVIDVDLPESLSHAILYISDLYPNANILMPHEVDGKNFNDYDFVFLTPNQISLIDDDSIDVSINTFSFQEMTSAQIKEYFDLVQRSGRNDSLFMTTNRVEKIPYVKLDSDSNCEYMPNRFSEYPWSPVNEILIYQICEFMRQVQSHSVFIRMERVNGNL